MRQLLKEQMTPQRTEENNDQGRCHVGIMWSFSYIMVYKMNILNIVVSNERVNQ